MTRVVSSIAVLLLAVLSLYSVFSEQIYEGNVVLQPKVFKRYGPFILENGSRVSVIFSANATINVYLMKEEDLKQWDGSPHARRYEVATSGTAGSLLYAAGGGETVFVVVTNPNNAPVAIYTIGIYIQRGFQTPPQYLNYTYTYTPTYTYTYPFSYNYTYTYPSHQPQGTPTTIPPQNVTFPPPWHQTTPRREENGFQSFAILPLAVLALLLLLYLVRRRKAT